ncbi:leucine-rich repeat-containing protein 34-like [Actinia tenebrosa]|uniref:Leucine-rich repeat-containing protein 34-like n=1 Tax=Actinia tenebrosa TaxID=6105 RepID=A0A6P8I0Y5_ACTTE|nr:leucine-rich repeat-containing protein 34-like [Actinia tenebrosa]
MGDASATKDDYLKACADVQKEPNAELLAIFNTAIDDSFTEPCNEFYLKLNGNKRNEWNEMYRKRLVDEDVDILYKTLKPNTFVVLLDLGYNNIGDKGAMILDQLLQETLVLQTLVLSYNDIGPEGGEAIAKGLQVNETLRELKLNGNKIGNKGGMAIAGTLQVNTVLEELDISEVDLKTESVIAMATVLNYNNTLKVLVMNRPLLFSHQEETTVHIARMLKVNIRLKEIHLTHYDIRDFGAERIKENLYENLTLTHLNLSSNNITRDGAKQLAILLKKNTPLEVLNLAYNRIEDDGAVAIAEALASYNTNLTTLVVCSNNIASQGLCAIAKAMKLNISLRGVYIWGNNLEEPACRAFQDLISGSVPRMEPNETDVQPYVVDGVVYLSHLNNPY